MKKAIAVVLLGGLCAVEAGAATITWTGAAGEWDYGAAGNWSPALPKNNDYQDIVRFGGTATPGTISVITPYGTSSSRQHEGVEFTSAGWTLDVDYSSLGKVNSAGVGTNTINYGFEVQQAGTWTIGEGNTLSIAKVLYLKNFNVTLAGGGTLLTNGGLGGYGSGTFGMHLTGGTTLRIDAAQVHDGGTTAKVYISDSLSKLELKTTDHHQQDQHPPPLHLQGEQPASHHKEAGEEDEGRGAVVLLAGQRGAAGPAEDLPGDGCYVLPPDPQEAGGEGDARAQVLVAPGLFSDQCPTLPASGGFSEAGTRRYPYLPHYL